ncbi:MAG: hypothetical protein ABIG93_00760 [archaeon]|nr:hypothetical protein [Nanoarchaeota archaeon]
MVRKVHTRAKRKFKISTNTNYKINLKGSIKKVRPKTFKNEEAAHVWAKAQGLKDYKLRNLRLESASDKKIRVELA